MDKEIFKKVATEFFYHWWNAEGNNTSEGFDKWWENKGQEVVKNCSIPDDVGQSEQLLALARYMCEHQNNLDGKTAKDYVQDFLSQ